MRGQQTRAFALTAFFCLAGAAVAAPGTSFRDPQTWRDSIRHSIDFFEQNAWDEASGSYATNLDVEGGRKDEIRHLIASSRMLYGLAHGSEVEPAYLEKARRQADFLQSAFMKEAADGPWFVKAVGPDGEATDAPTALVVNEQAYGLNGLVALYRRTGDRGLLDLIRRTHDSFVARFRDTGKGGFFDGYDLESGEPTRTKSYNSTVYVATAYLLELAEADEERRDGYREILQDLGNQVAENFYDPATGWIIENFTEDWQADWRSWQSQPEGTIGVVGHNFQAAWFLMRLADFPGIPEERSEAYRESAGTILASMLSKPAHDREFGGFQDVFVRETDQPMWHTNKPWWQQAEGILALTYAIRSGLVRTREAIEVRDQAASFYLTRFLDRTRGGEYEVVTREGHVTPDVNKGTPGKSTYHTVELARYMLEYLSGGPQ